MEKLIPSNRGDLVPNRKVLQHILVILENSSTKVATRTELLKKSKLTKTQTLRAVEVLIDAKKVVHDQIKNLFYLL